ncbi:MAG: hypothetical protein JKY59_02670 [Emcibacter sp.]|nr:hypothetical protein [Emcibacter sp.]
MTEEQTLKDMMLDMGRTAKAAAESLANVPTDKKNTALIAAARHLRADKGKILSANGTDMEKAKERGIAPPCWTVCCWMKVELKVLPPL